MRVATTRFGIVLGAHGGALAQFAKNARMFINGPLGSGRQWLSWIHLEDVIRGLLFILRPRFWKAVLDINANDITEARADLPVLAQSLRRDVSLGWWNTRRA